MYDVYSWSTSNGRKVHIMLEELGVEDSIRSISVIDGAERLRSHA